MAQNVNATNLQKLEYDVTTAEGPSHITIVSGLMPVNLAGNPTGSFETLVDPTLALGKFRKATATASIVNWSVSMSGATGPQNNFEFSIDQIEATLDDESGKIQLRIDVSVQVTGAFQSAQINTIAFQVTTLSIQ